MNSGVQVRPEGNSICLLTGEYFDKTTRPMTTIPYRPFDRVPPELISHILIMVWQSDAEKDDSIDRFRFPTIPMQVNRYFYKTAVSTPLLWSYIRVTPTGDLNHLEDRIENKSGALPLDLYIILGRTEYMEIVDMFDRTILLSPSRVRTITLSYRYDDLDYDPPGDFWEHLLLLTHLPAPLNPTRFSVINENPEVPPLDILPTLGCAVRSLRFTDCCLQWSAVSFPASVEVLSIEEGEVSVDVPGATVGRALGGSLSHSLRSLSLRGLTVEGAEHMPMHTCVLNKLEELKIDDFDFRCLVALLVAIRTPHIQDLSLKTIYHSAYILPAFDLFWDLLQFPRLRRVEIQGFIAGRLRLDNLMKSLPESVVRLEVRGDWGELRVPMADNVPYALAQNAEEVRELIAKNVTRKTNNHLAIG